MRSEPHASPRCGSSEVRLSWRLVSRLCLALSGALGGLAFAQSHDGGLPGAGQAIVGREGSPPDPRPTLPEAEGSRLADRYRRLEALSIKAIAPGSRRAQDAAIDEAIDVAAEALAICEQFQGAQTAAGRAWRDAGGLGEWWELVEARHWWHGWKRIKEISSAGRTALGLAALMKPQFEAAERGSRWDEAIAISRRQKATLETHLGKDHPYALEAWLNEGRMLNAKEAYEEAANLFDQLIPVQVASLGPHHPKTLAGKMGLASAYRWSNRRERAVELLEDVVHGRRLVLGAAHGETLEAVDDLVAVLTYLNRHNQALPLAEDLRATYAKALGDTHWRTLDAAEKLAWTLLQAGRPAEALELASRSLKDAETPQSISDARCIRGLLRTQETSQHELAVNSWGTRAIRDPYLIARIESLRARLALASAFSELETKPDMIRVWASLATSLWAIERCAEAKAEVRNALALFDTLSHELSDDWYLLKDLGAAALVVGDVVRAGDLMSRAWDAVRAPAAGSTPDEIALLRMGAWTTCMGLLEVLASQGSVDQALATIDQWRGVDIDRSPAELADLERHLWWRLGSQLTSRGWPAQAARVWRIRLDAVGERGTPEEITSVKDGLASALEEAGNYNDAETICRELYEVAVSRHGATSTEAIQRLNSLGYLLKRAHKINEAVEVCRQVLALGEQAGLPAEPLEIYRGNLAESLREGRLLHEAETHARETYKRRLAAFGEMGQLTIQAAALVADVLSNRGQHDDAIAMLTALKAPIVNHFGADSAEHFSVVHSLQNALWAAGRPHESLEAVRERLQIQRHRYPNGGERLITAVKIAGIDYYLAGDFATGAELLSEAVGMAESRFGVDDPLTLSMLYEQVDLYRQLGDFQLAGELGRRFFEAMNARRSREGVLPAQTELRGGLLLLRICNDDGAQRNESVDQQLVPHLPGFLARLEDELGQDAVLVRAFKRELADFYIARGEYANAEPLLLGAVEWCRDRLGSDHRQTLQAMNRLALARSAEGRLEEAAAVYLELLGRPDLTEPHLREFGQSVRWNLANIREKQGRYEEALLLLVEIRAQGANDLHDARRLAYLPVKERRGRWTRIYNNLGFTLRTAVMAKGGLAIAMNAAMQRKSLLQDLAAAEIASARARRDPTVSARLRALVEAQRHLADAMARGITDEGVLGRLERDVGNAERAVRLAAPALETLDNQLGQGIREIAALLKPTEAIIEFVCYHPTLPVASPDTEIVSEAAAYKQYAAFILRPDPAAAEGHSLFWVHLGSADGIEAAVAAFRRLVESPASSDVLDPSTSARGVTKAMGDAVVQLRSAVWDPIEPHLHGVSRMFVSMDGALHGVPLEVLGRYDAEGVLRYLIEWAGAPEIAYVGSGRELLRPRAGAANGPGGLVAFVDPDFDAPIRKDAKQAVGGGARNELDGRLATREQGMSLGLSTLGGGIGDEPLLPIFGREDEDFGSRYVAALGAITLTGPGEHPENGNSVWHGHAASEAAWRQMFSEEPNRPGGHHGPRVIVFTTHGLFSGLGQKGAIHQGPEGGTERNVTEPFVADPMLRVGLALAGYNAVRWPRAAGTDDSSVAGGGVLGDGLLTALEVAGTDLRGVELVVLTACHSGQGTVLPGEAVVGLRAGFSVAGVSSSVASLWAIPAAASTDFTRDYLRRINTSIVAGTPGRDYVAQFRAAQLEMLSRVRSRDRSADAMARGNSHPFWWAGFVFQGVPK